MPNDYKRQDLTEREKAILIFGIVTDCHDWKKLYILSREQPLKTTSAGNIATAASRWKYQSKVKKFVEEQTALFKAKADAIRNEANAAGNDGGTDPDQETQTDGETKTKKAKEEKRLNIDFQIASRGPKTILTHHVGFWKDLFCCFYKRCLGFSSPGFLNQENSLVNYTQTQ